MTAAMPGIRAFERRSWEDGDVPKLTDEYRERRRRFIETRAFACFARDGFGGTSMEDIVAATGLSAPAVYRYIGSKEELIVSAAVESVRQVDRAMATLLDLDPVPGPVAAVGVMMRQFDLRTEELGFDVGGLVVASWSEAARRVEVRTAAAEVRGAFRTTLIQLAQAWLDNGQIPAGSDPAKAALAISYLLPGILVERQLTGSMPEPERLMAGMAAISQSALSSPGP
jgi:AcrR family transcriptional regulator